MDELNLGLRLRHIREERGFSQRELARLAGIGNATISAIESNTTNPSVGALKRILDCIPIAIGDFFSFELTEPAKRFYRANELVEIGRGGISSKQVGRNRGERAIQLISECYAVGSDTGKAPLSHIGVEAGIVIKGKLEVTVGDEKFVLKSGDAYYFDSTEPHRFRNAGAEPCEVISACTPPSF